MQTTDDNHRQFWRKTLRMIAVMLSISVIATFVVSYFSRDLDFNFLGWPHSFWMGAQGSLNIYMAIICFYAGYRNKLDIEHGVDEAQE